MAETTEESSIAIEIYCIRTTKRQRRGICGAYALTPDSSIVIRIDEESLFWFLIWDSVLFKESGVKRD